MFDTPILSVRASAVRHGV